MENWKQRVLENQFDNPTMNAITNNHPTPQLLSHNRLAFLCRSHGVCATNGKVGKRQRCLGRRQSDLRCAIGNKQRAMMYQNHGCQMHLHDLSSQQTTDSLHFVYSYIFDDDVLGLSGGETRGDNKRKQEKERRSERGTASTTRQISRNPINRGVVEMQRGRGRER